MLISSKFRSANITCKQAYEVADRLIVIAAKNLASDHETVTVVGVDDL